MKNQVMDIVLRPATRRDIPLLQYWDDQPHKKQADPHSDWQWESEIGRSLPWRRQLIAELKGRPLAYVEILRCSLDEEQYWGNVPGSWAAIDMWLGEQDDIGLGYGTRILQLALKMCFSDMSVEVVVVDPITSNSRARRFYERNGFQYVEERKFGVDQCAVYKLTRSAWEGTGNAI